MQPDNIMLVRDPAVPGGERVKLLDFGIAKLRDPNLRKNLTKGDSLLGTDQAFSFGRRDRLSGSARYLHWKKVKLAGCCVIACGLCDSGAYGIT